MPRSFTILSNGITLPVIGVLMAPVTAIWGGNAAYNTALLLSIFVAGAAGFLRSRELTGSPPPWRRSAVCSC